MRSFILEVLATALVGSAITGCGGSTEIHSLGNLPDTGGAPDTSSTITTTTGGAGGAGGSGGGGNGGAGGGGGMLALPDCSDTPDDRCRLVADHDIRALATDRSRLYWVEYGTEDGLGNPLYDGKLMAQDLDGGTPELLRADLGGPVGLQLSESYFYVQLERWQDENGAETEALVRLPRAGGAAELIQPDLRPHGPNNNECLYPCFAATSDFSYFYHRSGIHRVSEAPGAASSQLWPDVDWQGFVASSDDTVYFNLAPGRFQQLRFEAEQPEQLLETPVRSMQWDADGLYWLEGADSTIYLMRWQPGEGTPRRVAALGSGPTIGMAALKLTDGNYYAHLFNAPEAPEMIVSGSLAEPEQVTTRVEFDSHFDIDRYLTDRWVGTSDAIYWIEDDAILRTP